MNTILLNVFPSDRNFGVTPVHLISIHISTVICTLSQKNETLSLFQNLRKITAHNNARCSDARASLASEPRRKVHLIVSLPLLFPPESIACDGGNAFRGMNLIA